MLVVAFDAGGAFPDTTAFLACGLLVALALRVVLAAAPLAGWARATKVLPGTFPTEAGVLEDRLGFPLTYWNALGLLSGIGIVLATALSADADEPLPARMAAAGALPVLACTLYFTF